MAESEHKYVLYLSRDEAWELFARCMNSPEADTDTSTAVLQKLNQLLESPDSRLAG